MSRQPPAPPATLRWRLTALYGGLFLAAGVALLAITYLLVERQLQDHAAAHPFSFAGEGGEYHQPFEELQGLEELAGREGLEELEELELDLPLSPVPGGSGEAAPSIRVGDLLHDALQGQREDVLGELLTQSVIALGITAVIAGVLGWVVAGRALRPLRDITATARRLSTDNLSDSLNHRIGLRGPRGELTELATTFDAMLDRLAASFEAQRRFVASASHELRTPLTVQRAAIDVALADPQPSVESLTAMATRVRAATERHERVISSLLTLAHSQGGVERYEDVDLAAVTVLASTSCPDAAEQGIRLTSQLRPAPLRGDRVLLERLAANLIDNGLRYNVSQGWLSVETSGGPHGAELRVANSGPPVPPERVAELFQPFRRLSEARTGGGGTGLGLSIVAAIAQAHSGSCQARARPEGGLEVTVWLPAQPLPTQPLPARPLSAPPLPAHR